uniref:Uncharacterized protein n=1 Tax=Rhizophora mucronata TaxID=61149 RepID=A0A2P2LDN0_RHIMU
MENFYCRTNPRMIILYIIPRSCPTSNSLIEIWLFLYFCFFFLPLLQCNIHFSYNFYFPCQFSSGASICLEVVGN